MTDTFYCVDGSISVALDQNGMAHVVFGISRVLHDTPGTTYQHYYLVDGIGYWNETMESFYGINGLDPDILYEEGQLIGWTQDVNNDGEITLLSEVFVYQEIGLSTMPYICIDDQNRQFVTWSSTTETYENGTYNYKHVWTRCSPDGGTSWGNFVDLCDDAFHMYDECIYASLSHTSNENIHVIYQADFDPGIALVRQKPVQHQYFELCSWHLLIQD